MENLYNNYLKTLRDLVKEFIDDYKDDNFNDDYKKANEFLLNYTFGKYEKGEYILELEEKFQSSLDKLIHIEKIYDDSFR